MKDVDEVDGDGGDGGGVGADVGGDQLILSCLRGFALWWMDKQTDIGDCRVATEKAFAPYNSPLL